MSIKVILTDLDGVIRHFPSQRDGAIEKRFGIPAGAIARIAFADGLLQQVMREKSPMRPGELKLRLS
jgi:putative hydrolase of the HAD superfamily